MPALLVNKETELALKGVRAIDKRASGELVKIAREKSKTESTEHLGEALCGALRVAYAPLVAVAPPPTVAMLNRFMRRVDWTYIAERLIVNPELN